MQRSNYIMSFNIIRDNKISKLFFWFTRIYIQQKIIGAIS